MYVECVGPVGSIVTSEGLVDFSPQSQEQRNKKKITVVGKQIHALLHHSYKVLGTHLMRARKEWAVYLYHQVANSSKGIKNQKEGDLESSQQMLME